MRFKNVTVICRKQQQRGVALLIMLLLLIVGSAFLFTGNSGHATKTIENDKQTADALARAKEALLGYAAADTTGSRRGELPCPDFNNDGLIVLVGPTRDYNGSNCRTLVGGVVRPGWLPWQFLKLSDLRDGKGDRLWYVVVNAFHANGSGVLNSDTTSAMSVDGSANIVAIIFSPGSPQPGQTGRPGNNALIALTSYLDGTNADGNLAYVSTGAGVNDRLLTITRDELMQVVERRVLREAKKCLDAYAALSSGKYPWAAQLPGGGPLDYTGDFSVTFGRIPQWGSVNRQQTPGVNDPTMLSNWSAGCFTFATAGSFWAPWRELLLYQIAPGYQPGSAATCPTCVTLDANNAARAVVLMAGRTLGGQVRVSNPNKRVRANYLEGGNQDIDLLLTNPLVTQTINDQAICVDGNNLCR